MEEKSQSAQDALFNQLVNEPGKVALVSGGAQLDFQKIGRVVADGTDSSPIIIDISTDEGKAQLAALKELAAQHDIVLDTPENFQGALEDAEKRKKSFDAIKHAIAMAQMHPMPKMMTFDNSHVYRNLNYKRVNGKWAVRR